MSEYTPTTEDLIAALRRKAEFHNHFSQSALTARAEANDNTIDCECTHD